MEARGRRTGPHEAWLRPGALSGPPEPGVPASMRWLRAGRGAGWEGSGHSSGCRVPGHGHICPPESRLPEGPVPHTSTPRSSPPPPAALPHSLLQAPPCAEPDSYPDQVAHTHVPERPRCCHGVVGTPAASQSESNCAWRLVALVVMVREAGGRRLSKPGTPSVHGARRCRSPALRPVPSLCGSGEGPRLTLSSRSAWAPPRASPEAQRPAWLRPAPPRTRGLLPLDSGSTRLPGPPRRGCGQ